MNEEYERYLQSEKWKSLRAKRIQMDGGVCNICGSKQNLQVHHLNYNYFDTTDNLITLCENCHHDIHNFHNEVMESIRSGEIKQKMDAVIDAVLDLKESYYQIVDKYVFQRAKEFSTNGDVTFFTGDRFCHTTDKDGHTGGTKLNRYLYALNCYAPYGYNERFSTLLSLNAYDTEHGTAPSRGYRGFNTYQSFKNKFFGTSKNKKSFSPQELYEDATKAGLRGVSGSYLKLLLKLEENPND